MTVKELWRLLGCLPANAPVVVILDDPGTDGDNAGAPVLRVERDSCDPSDPGDLGIVYLVIRELE